MQNCGFGWQNVLLSAALSGNGVSGLPVTNLQTQQGAASLAWRVAAGGTGWSADVKAALGSVQLIRAISLHRTNLTTAATWRIQIRNGTTVTFNQAASANIQNGQCLRILGTPVSGDSLEITVWDASNPDGFISIPLAYAGPLWQPLRNYSSESTESLTVGQQSTTTLSGGEFVDARYVQRGLSITHQSYGDADAAVLRQIQRTAATGQNILFLPDPDSAPPALAETALFGRLSGGDLSNPFGPADRHAQTLTLTERL
ncbi:hypothetical protein [Gluconobacter cerinus]|uniref:hypothetical protein n=1 Tax=Gluconobacter cerinus TaxID=38307 RepID=UPI001B8D303A|nr:hypothetical protein [Gluconobacter cerinus]MBS1026071.1 hypothetical protein [Gluconobacter cerinus]